MVQFPAVPRGRDPILACFWPFGNYFDLKNEFFGHGYHMAGLRSADLAEKIEEKKCVSNALKLSETYPESIKFFSPPKSDPPSGT